MTHEHTHAIAAKATKAPEMKAFEEVLACNIKDVIGDLCMADADVIMSYATNQLHGNMREIITSAAELYFKDNTLTYAHGADVSLEWGHPPCIVLDMEFVHGPVSVFFKLVLGGQHIGVQINRMLLNEGVDTATFDSIEFGQVLSSARLQPLPPRFAPSYCPKGVTRH
jgi:hypothetical protein